MSWKASAAVKDLRQDSQGKTLTPSEKCLLYTLADYYHEESQCAWPSIKRAASESMISERQASRIISDLQQRGILDVEHRKNDTSVYRFKFGPYVKIEIEIPPEETGGGGDNLSLPKELPGVTGDGHGPTKTGGGGDIAMSDEPPLTAIEPKRTNTHQNGSKPEKGPVPVLFSQEEMDKQDPVVRVWVWYHRVLERGGAYTLTDRRREKGRVVFKHALKLSNGNAEAAAQLMRLAVDNMAASAFHVEKGFVSWEKNLFKSVEQFEEWIDPMEKEKRA